MKKLVSQKVKVTGDIPSPRFGHTFTMVSPTKAVLFGGAVCLAGKFVITNDVFLFDFTQSRWTKINFKEQFVPSERAAHAAVMVSEMQMIIYGGAASGTQGLLKDELYILDLRKQPVWKIIEVANKNRTPGQRYGHTMLFNKPYLVVFAGNSGNKAENDVWLLNILKGPFTWEKYEFQNKVMPSPRVYHSAAICEEGSALGMMVVFGGRKETKKDHNGSQRQLTVAALNDIWGLRKHRNGTWDWVTPPKSDNYTPLCRYQHLVCFMGSNLIIMGGRSSNPEEAVSMVEIYDTEKSQWHRLASLSRYRHAIALYNTSKLYVHGGFQPDMIAQPLESMVIIDLGSYLSQSQKEEENMCKNDTTYRNDNGRNAIEGESNLTCNQTKTLQETKRGELAKHEGIRRELREINQIDRNLPLRDNRLRAGTAHTTRSKLQRQLTPSRLINKSKNIRLSNQVVVATGDNNNIQIQRVPVNSLLEESKKLTSQPEDQQFDFSAIELVDNILAILMPANTGKPTPTALFPFKKDKINRLCQEATKVVVRESSLLGVRTPVKIFGSIYGRYYDLLKIFDSFGFPDERQMESNEYVFLGNYVDKGFNSLQTICLLMALKIKYAEHIVLLRGRHEDINVNRICGLAEECSIRLGQNIQEINSVYNSINTFFQCLPLAAAIEDKYLCVHSGIGSIERLLEIKDIVRPIKAKGNSTVADLLWSGGDTEKGLGYDTKISNEAIVDKFLEENGLQMLINTRDGLSQGVGETSNTLSVFSVTNYANSGNKAGILKITKNFAVTPYLLNSSPSKKGLWVNQHNGKASIVFNPSELQVRKNMFKVV